MSSARDGMNYAPPMKAQKPVVAPGDFVFAAAQFDHGHIYAQIDGLAGAGGVLKYVLDPRPERYAKVLEKYPGCRVATRLEEILDDPSVHLVTAAAVPCDRCALGLRVMAAGKDYLTDKSPFTTLAQLDEARAAARSTGRKYMVCYSERLLNEATWYAGELIRQGAIGRVLQVLNLAPHNLSAKTRPAWFFRKAAYGGILTDIGSHQFEQFLTFASAADARIEHARVDNLGHPEYPELEDFGEGLLTMDNGASCYCRVDWFNPAGLRSWGDGRTFVMGTTGSIEIRKNIDVARGTGGNLLFLVDGGGEHEIPCQGRIGFPYFGRLILDVLNRTENAMTQEHAFKAAELSMQAQKIADLARG
ncbi:MAG TPA: Gfo/Idh/MocA family oxidoreductase [Kiritimatiellia bacterium]|nr:Gfo/Idh/MocA family oxidoreductase [Kiritimatiellia bacterium]